MRLGMAEIRYKYLTKETNRHGKTVWYVRINVDGKYKRVRLHEDAGSEAFLAEYHAARKQLGAPQPKPVTVKQHSLEWLVNKYYGGAKFRLDYSEATRRQHRNILGRICEEHGHRDARTLTSKAIRAGRDARAETPGAANNYLKTLKALFKWAVEQELAETNPVAGIQRLKPKSQDGHHTWTAQECQKFEAKHPLGTTARLAYALMLYAGPRRSDVVRLGRQHITSDGFLAWDQFKSEGKSMSRVQVPILQPLQEAIDATPQTGMHFLLNGHGRPFTSNSFGNRMKKWTHAAGLPGRCAAHGLRKALAVRLAEGDASENQIAAVLGHSDTSSAKIYTRKASQKRLAEAAMRTIAEESVAPSATVSKAVRQNGDKNK